MVTQNTCNTMSMFTYVTDKTTHILGVVGMVRCGCTLVLDSSTFSVVKIPLTSL